MPVSTPAPRLLCVPVSGAFGMGEYARCLAIAHAVAARWPDAAIHFVLSSAAPYAAAVPFACTLVSSSPTFHTPVVRALIESFRPTCVLFDNAGRTAQLRAARRAGAQVVYVSARARQRRKAFRWSWMRLLDEHWIAYPAFSAGALDPWERLKLRLLGRPVVRFLDVILPRADPARQAELLAAMGLTRGRYCLVVPGGGTGHPRAADAAARFLAAASALAAVGPTLFVGPTAAVDKAANARDLRLRTALPQRDLAELMRGARLVVANGGSTLLQAIACGAPTIGIAIAKDQNARIRRCVAAGVAAAAGLDSGAITALGLSLLRNDTARAALAAAAARLGLADGIAIAVDAIAARQAQRMADTVTGARRA
jgi:glycosyltransferase involved in cell wall biosynthesis